MNKNIHLKLLSTANIFIFGLNMSVHSIKEKNYEDDINHPNIEVGALGPSYSFSASAEKKLVWKIDLM